MAEIFTAPWYPWYADDILLSERVELMNLAEEGAYRRALDRAWIKGSLPADPKMCARTIGKGCSTRIAEVVLRMFRPSDDDPTRMINDTLEKIREQQKQKYETQAAKGRKGGATKKQGSSPAKTQPEHKASHSDSDSEEDSLTREKKEREPVATDFGEPQNRPPKESLFYHPVIETIREVTGKNPPAEARQILIDRAGGTIDRPRFVTTFGKWRAAGFKDTNFAGMLDWYNGKQNGNGRAPKNDVGKYIETETKPVEPLAECITCYDNGQILESGAVVPCPQCGEYK